MKTEDKEAPNCLYKNYEKCNVKRICTHENICSKHYRNNKKGIKSINTLKEAGFEGK